MGMETKLDEARLARVAEVAQALCAAQGSFELREIVTATQFDRALVRDALALLTRRGSLLAWPGERFAPPIARPGSSWPTELRRPTRALVGTR
jgi:hypothetical protein